MMSLDERSVHARFAQTLNEVLWLLEEYPSARNNDFYLQLMWLKKYGKLDLPYIEWDTIKEFGGRLETIRRTRQKIQNEMGLFPPTEPTRKRRNRQAMIIRRAINQW